MIKKSRPWNRISEIAEVEKVLQNNFDKAELTTKNLQENKIIL